jgi:hypothetical protein
MTAVHQATPPPSAADDVVLDDLVEALTEMLAQRDRAVTALTVVVAELRADIETLAARFEPEQPRAGYVALKAAAARVGCSGEHMRQLCIRGQVDAHRVGNKWFVDVAALEFSNKPRSGKDRA